MKHPVTFKALRVFSWLFLLSGGLVFALAVIATWKMGMTPPSETSTHGLEMAAHRYGIFGLLFAGGFYSVALAFIGLIARAMSHLVGEIQ